MCIKINFYTITNYKMKEIIRRLLKKEKNDGNQTTTQPSYREQLAANLQTLRSYKEWKRLAEALLREEKLSEDYLSSMKEGKKLPKEMAESLMKRWRFKLLIKYLDKFNICHRKVVAELFKHWEKTFLIENLDKFKWINLQKIINKFINDYDWERVSILLEKYSNFNGYTVDRLIKSRESEIVVNHLNSFKLTHSEIADRMFICGAGYTLAKNLDKFQWLNHQELAIRLTKNWYGEYVLEYRDNFQCEDELLKEIAILMIKKWDGWNIFEHLDKFCQSSLKELWELLVVRWYGAEVRKNLDKFKWLDSQRIIHNLISIDPDFLIRNLKTLDWLDHNKLVKNLIKDDRLYSVAYNLGKLKGLNIKFAKILCKNHRTYYVANNLDSFAELDVEVAEILIKAWYKDVVLQNPEKFWLRK